MWRINLHYLDVRFVVKYVEDILPYLDVRFVVKYVENKFTLFRCKIWGKIYGE